MCDRVAIMKSGKIIEQSDTKTIFENANSLMQGVLFQLSLVLKRLPIGYSL